MRVYLDLQPSYEEIKPKMHIQLEQFLTNWKRVTTRFVGFTSDSWAIRCGG